MAHLNIAGQRIPISLLLAMQEGLPFEPGQIPIPRHLLPGEQPVTTPQDVTAAQGLLPSSFPAFQPGQADQTGQAPLGPGLPLPGPSPGMTLGEAHAIQTRNAGLGPRPDVPRQPTFGLLPPPEEEALLGTEEGRRINRLIFGEEAMRVPPGGPQTLPGGQIGQAGPSRMTQESQAGVAPTPVPGAPQTAVPGATQAAPAAPTPAAPPASTEPQESASLVKVAHGAVDKAVPGRSFGDKLMIIGLMMQDIGQALQGKPGGQLTKFLQHEASFAQDRQKLLLTTGLDFIKAGAPSIGIPMVEQAGIPLTAADKEMLGSGQFNEATHKQIIGAIVAGLEAKLSDEEIAKELSQQFRLSRPALKNFIQRVKRDLEGAKKQAGLQTEIEKAQAKANLEKAQREAKEAAEKERILNQAAAEERGLLPTEGALPLVEAQRIRAGLQRPAAGDVPSRLTAEQARTLESLNIGVTPQQYEKLPADVRAPIATRILEAEQQRRVAVSAATGVAAAKAQAELKQTLPLDEETRQRTYDPKTGQLAPAGTSPDDVRAKGYRILSKEQNAKLIEGDATRASVEELAALYRRELVGPFRGRVGKVGELVGLIGKNEAAFRAQVAQVRNATIKFITGAQMSEPEARRIREQIPDANNPTVVFEARLEQTLRNFEFVRKAMFGLLAGLRKAGDPVELPKEESAPQGRTFERQEQPSGVPRFQPRR